jgi:hypothetical protein
MANQSHYIHPEKALAQDYHSFPLLRHGWVGTSEHSTTSQLGKILELLKDTEIKAKKIESVTSNSLFFTIPSLLQESASTSHRAPGREMHISRIRVAECASNARGQPCAPL